MISFNELKMMIAKSEIGSNMLISGLCKPFSLIISYLYVPIVLSYLGVEKYGIWSTILTILSWISYFDIGIGNGLRNRLAASLSVKDGESRKLVSSAYAVIAVIMTAVTIVFCAVASVADWERIFGVTGIDENIAGVVCTSVILVAANFIISICKNVLYAIQKAGSVSVMELIVQILNLSGVLVATRIVKSNLLVMALIYGLSMLVVNFVASIIIYRNNREVCPAVSCVDYQVGKSITNLGLQFFIIQICGLVLFTTDSLIISSMYGAANVTPYATVNKLFNVIIGIYSALLVPVWSAVTKDKAEGKFHEIKLLAKKLILLMCPFVLGTVFLALVFRDVSAWWLRQELEYSTGLIALGAMYCLMSNWCNTFAYIANGMELMKMSMIVAVVQASVNIPLSLYFAECMEMGSAGVLAGTVCSMAIAAVVVPIAVYKEIKCS